MKKVLRIMSIPNKYLFVVKEDRGIVIGAKAVHNSQFYINQYPNGSSIITECTENNQLSIDEHWREILYQFPLNKEPLLEGVPVLNINTLAEPATLPTATVEGERLFELVLRKTIHDIVNGMVHPTVAIDTILAAAATPSASVPENGVGKEVISEWSKEYSGRTGDDNFHLVALSLYKKYTPHVIKLQRTKKNMFLLGCEAGLIHATAQPPAQVEEDAVAFAEWIDTELWIRDNNGRWIDGRGDGNTKTTAELYQIFQSKNKQ